jgi:hypothetical protein
MTTFQTIDRTVRGVLIVIFGAALALATSYLIARRDGAPAPAPAPLEHAPVAEIDTIIGTARKPLVIVGGTTQQIPDADYLHVPGGVSVNASVAQAGDVEATEINQSTSPLGINSRVAVTPPALTTAHPYGLFVDVAGSGSDPQTQQAIRGELEDGYAGTNDPIATTGINHSTHGDPAVGVTGQADGAGTNNFGGLFRAQNATHNVGLCAALDINCHRISNTGVPFDTPLLLDNGVSGKPIFIATSNGNTVLQLDDNGTLDWAAGQGPFIAKDGQIGIDSAVDDDTGTLLINHEGFNFGATRFRSIDVQDGKGNNILTVAGATKAVKAFASVEVERMINAATVPSVVCDDGTPTPTGGEWKGHVAPAIDATTCALTFAHTLVSCICSLKLDHVQQSTGIGHACSFTGAVLTVTAAPSTALGEFDYDCSVAN